VLEQFLALLPESFRYAVEFRHPSWDRREVWEILRSRGVATVWSSSLWYPLFLQATADFLYLRFHGLHGGFAHRYTREELLPWVERVCTALRQGMSVYATSTTPQAVPLRMLPTSARWCSSTYEGRCRSD
jgi:uncharacterized protein YecE (DUF72 family)